VLSILPAICATLAFQAPTVESDFAQVAPIPRDGREVRSKDQTRAVVLIHGYQLRVRSSRVPRAQFHAWQHSGRPLVERLAKEADVFVFAYGQNVALDEVVKHSSLGARVAGLRRLGYKEIVLVGHSAGGLIARHFVEDNPDAGVTKVIQVCSPNCGTPTARQKVLKSQQAFVDSLTEEARNACLKTRVNKSIPRGVEFVCLLANTDGRSDTDGVVPCLSQWPEDLRKQGVPVVALGVGHREAMRTERGAEALAKLVREKQPRWEPARTERVFKDLFKK
jgi:pimeloyl-ACP methyl ester carboxylesterase